MYQYKKILFTENAYIYIYIFFFYYYIHVKTLKLYINTNHI